MLVYVNTLLQKEEKKLYSDGIITGKTKCKNSNGVNLKLINIKVLDLQKFMIPVRRKNIFSTMKKNWHTKQVDMNDMMINN